MQSESIELKCPHKPDHYFKLSKEKICPDIPDKCALCKDKLSDIFESNKESIMQEYPDFEDRMLFYETLINRDILNHEQKKEIYSKEYEEIISDNKITDKEYHNLIRLNEILKLFKHERRKLEKELEEKHPEPIKKPDILFYIDNSQVFFVKEDASIKYKITNVSNETIILKKVKLDFEAKSNKDSEKKKFAKEKTKHKEIKSEEIYETFTHEMCFHNPGQKKSITLEIEYEKQDKTRYKFKADDIPPQYVFEAQEKDNLTPEQQIVMKFVDLGIDKIKQDEKRGLVSVGTGLMDIIEQIKQMKDQGLWEEGKNKFYEKIKNETLKREPIWTFVELEEKIEPTANLTPPKAKFTAKPTRIKKNESVILEWESENTHRVNITPDIGIPYIGLQGKTEIKPQQTTTYTLETKGPGGTATYEQTITVISDTINLKYFDDNNKLIKSFENLENSANSPYIFRIGRHARNESPPKTYFKNNIILIDYEDRYRQPNEQISPNVSRNHIEIDLYKKKLRIVSKYQPVKINDEDKRFGYKIPLKYIERICIPKSEICEFKCSFNDSELTIEYIRGDLKPRFFKDNTTKSFFKKCIIEFK